MEVVGGVRQQLRPGLDVSLVAFDGSRGASTLVLGVRGGTTPVRLHLYVNGDLVESWMRAPAALTFDLGGLQPGRHAVTARAIDATGRWGGSSVVVAREDVPELAASS
jgi:Penicillin-Binding Protein C-terminus Family